MVLPAVSKRAEHIVHSQLVGYPDQPSILSNKQFRFRKNDSTDTCYLDVLEKLYIEVDNSKFSGLVFLNSKKKALDTVDHGILLHKLVFLGVSEQIIVWF